MCEIYPPVTIVNNTNISACKSNFLDMTISIYQGKFYFSLYDKRNDYDSDVISFLFLDGNIPKGQSYQGRAQGGGGRWRRSPPLFEMLTYNF